MRSRSEPELNPFCIHEVISRQNALHAWVLELIDAQVRFGEHPIIEIPVESCGDLISMVAERRNDSRRNRAGRNRTGITCGAGSSPLQPGISEFELPRAPARSARFAGRIW